jgi:hypothetical protein
MLQEIDGGISMSLAIQKTLFGPEKVIGDARTKLAELYHYHPEYFDKEKTVILQYWLEFDGLREVLGHRANEFIEWFRNATSPETITRCLRALKEDGTVKLSDKNIKRREERQLDWQKYWGNDARNRNCLFGGRR